LELRQYNISPEVTAFSTLRHGGFSIGTYSSFNANCYCGDNPDNVIKNRKLLCDYLDIPQDRLIIPHQVHQTKIVKVDVSFLSSSPEAQQQTLDGVDALITNEQGCCICVSTADCIPVIIYDPKHKASAIVHAGWRGTLSKICERALEKMHDSYGTENKYCHAVIGPGISKKNFEVGDEVYDAFSMKGFTMSLIAQRYKKWHIDLFECNRLQLVSSGIPDNQIYVSNICTYDCHKDFFSARRLGIDSGRILTGILIN
jgi:YfiH family protein